MRMHYNDVIMSAMAPQITSVNGLFRRRSKKHHSSASLAFVRGIHRWPVISAHKGPVTRKMFPVDDVIMAPELSFNHMLWYIMTATLFGSQLFVALAIEVMAVVPLIYSKNLKIHRINAIYKKSHLLFANRVLKKLCRSNSSWDNTLSL